MAEITRAQTISDLIAKVGSKLDISITAMSTPSISQVVSWLNDAALLMTRLMPEDRLGIFRTTITSDSVGASISITSQMSRILTVKKYGVVCTRLTQRDMDLVATRSPLLHTTKNPACCVSGDAGNVAIGFWPTSAGPVSIVAVRKPTAYTASGWAPDTYSLPPELELLAVDYAVIQGKIQDEEPQQAQVLYQMWVQQAGIEAQVEGLGVQT